MIPVINTAVNIPPAQTVLVATPLPDTNTLRVPFDNVPPSVSNAQINNNARGNGAYAAVESVDYAVPVTSASAPAAAPGQSSIAPGIPAAFIAQLVGQQMPVALQGALGGVLAEYEKMIVSSFTKYRPSNASLPPPPPSGVYGRILQQERAARVAPAPPAVADKQQPAERVEPVAQPAAPLPQIEAEIAAPIAEVTVAQPAQAAAPVVAREPAAPVQLSEPIVLPASAANAYQATSLRVQMAAPASVTDSI